MAFALSQKRINVLTTAMELLYATIVLNLWIGFQPTLIEFLAQIPILSFFWVYEWHSHSYTTLGSMLISLFMHVDWEHLLSNMFLLWMVGRKLFVPIDFETSREARWRWLLSSWRSPFCFLWIYFGSHVISVAGCRLLSQSLDREWERRVRQDRATWSWSWQWLPNSWKDAHFTLSNAQQAIELRVWQYVPMIGSSAAVFGVGGAYVYVALCNRQHPALMDSQTIMLWLAQIAVDFSRTPFYLDQLSLQENGDKIDHASHFCGFVGGFALAAVWHAFSNNIWRKNGRQCYDAQEV
jgi:membrane associated rhomboid family serine protease